MKKDARRRRRAAGARARVQNAVFSAPRALPVRIRRPGCSLGGYLYEFFYPRTLVNAIQDRPDRRTDPTGRTRRARQTRPTR